MNSIRNRLIAILIGFTCLIWLAAVGWIYYSTQTEIQKVLDARLMEAARMVNSLLKDNRLEVGADGGIGQFTPRPIPDFPDYDRQLFCQIWSLDGQLIGRSASAPEDQLTEEHNGFSYEKVSGLDWRVYTIENTQLGVRVMVADSMSIRSRLVRDVIAGFIIPALLILPLMAGMIWLSVRRGLAPLSRLTQNLTARSAQDLSPLKENSLTTEVAPVVKALNDLFVRVEEARERERNFAIFAAHELKTPLAGLKTQAQIAVNAKDDDMRSHAMRQIQTGVDRTTRLIKQLIDLASLEQDLPENLTRTECASQILATIAGDLSGLAAKRDVSINIADIDKDICIKHPDLFMLAARNLIENAILHSPKNSPVDCIITSQDDGIKFEVKDNGYGIPEAEMPHILNRFYSGSNKSENGSGLGLAIVTTATERVNGSFSIKNRRSNGIKATLNWPN